MPQTTAVGGTISFVFKQILRYSKVLLVRLGYTVPQNSAVGALFRFQADSSILKGSVRLGWDTRCFNRAVGAQFRFQADS